MHDGHRYGYAPRLVLDEAAGASIPSAHVNAAPPAVNAAPTAVNAAPSTTTAVNAGPTPTTATTTTAVNRAGFTGGVAARIHRVPELVCAAY